MVLCLRFMNFAGSHFELGQTSKKSIKFRLTLCILTDRLNHDRTLKTLHQDCYCVGAGKTKFHFVHKYLMEFGFFYLIIILEKSHIHTAAKLTKMPCVPFIYGVYSQIFREDELKWECLIF